MRNYTSQENIENYRRRPKDYCNAEKFEIVKMARNTQCYDVSMEIYWSE